MKRSTYLAPIVLCLLASSCAKHPTNPQDPYEPLNRNVYKFNNCIDHTIYRPAAQVYKHFIPPFMRTGVTNFFSNLEEPMSFANDLLQGKVRYAGKDLLRLVINSTIGIAGLFDVATKMGLHKHLNTFGDTFAYWSDNKKSPYLIIPFLGPSTFRDAFGIPFNVAAWPITYVRSDGLFYGTTALFYVNLRARLLPLNRMIDTAFDPYAAMRNAYLTKRNQTIQSLEEGDYVKGKTHDPQELDDYVHHGPKKQSVPSGAKDDYTFD